MLSIRGNKSNEIKYKFERKITEIVPSNMTIRHLMNKFNDFSIE